ncbi:MAG: LPS-assembly protein LptD [Candidatus Omnitrophica bacterium]|nr:LPS-assembly protein LptD [Candidatus Omnitrophota bacterium]
MKNAKLLLNFVLILAAAALLACGMTALANAEVAAKAVAEKTVGGKPAGNSASKNSTGVKAAGAEQTAAVGAPSESVTQQPVELNGDNVEYKADEGKFVASGNVVVHQQDGATLYCDRIEFYRDRQEGRADGNVVLDSDKGSVWAEKAFYNFKTKKGEFTNARIMSHPVFARGATISKIRDNYYVMSNGYFTTSDYDDPEWRVKSRHIEVFLGDKAIARNSTMYLGGVPVMYMPKYVQDLRKNRPHFSVIPGYSKAWGGFLLTKYRVYPAEGVETVYHLDYRERKGWGYGLDVALTTLPVGETLVKSYFLNERTIGAKHMWQPKTQPTLLRERYRAEWRHKWDINPQTNLILQYYKLSDSTILKDYFERQYLAESGPATYGLLSHSTGTSTVMLRMDKRVNRFESAVERLPEVSYSWNNQPIGDTGFYFKSTDAVVQLEHRIPGPTDRDHQTVRLVSGNEVSRPFKFGILELRPYTGAEHTYYTRTLDERNNGSVRGVWKAGSDLSTKFYRVYNVQFNRFGIEVNKLRHVLTPTVAYQYQHMPTLPSEKLYQFDSVDSRAIVNRFALGLESKFQTKREGKSVDLIRSLLSSNFRMRDDPSGASFGDVVLDNEFYVNKYVKTSHDITYNPDTQRLTSANMELNLTDTNRWIFDVSRRYVLNSDDIVTTQLQYKLNPKWRTVLYDRWNADNGLLQEQQYSLVRDLHSWEVEFSYKTLRGYTNSGSEVWVIFTLKAFPSVAFDGGKGFQQRKAGSQTPEL